MVCGNESSHTHAESLLYASGVPDVVRAARVEASHKQWADASTDVRAALLQTPIPQSGMAPRYVLRPPRRMVEAGYVEATEVWTPGRVFYGFRDPAWWGEHRDRCLTGASFDHGRTTYWFEQNTVESSVWKMPCSPP